MKKKLLEWWNTASPEQRERLASRVGTSQNYLRSHVMVGTRGVSADYAARIESAIAKINAGDKDLPAVDRRDLCEACRRCPFGAGLV